MRESKIVLRTTKVPHLLKGRFRDDIALRLKLIFFIALCTCHPEQREGTSFWESKIVLKTTKVPHLLKGRFRDDIALRLKVISLQFNRFPIWI